MVGIKLLKLAEEALEKSQDVEALHWDNSIIDTDATTETACKTLKHRYNFCQQILFPLQADPSIVQLKDFLMLTTT